VLRATAFISGILAALALLLFVVAGISHRTLPIQPRNARTATADTPQESGRLFAQPFDPSLAPSTPGDDADDGSRIDLQGDEVTPAVARYRFDAQGNIYETHAPHTEVPRLGSPLM
jgi:hypothetical protein